MAFKFVVFFAIASVATAGVIPVHDNAYDTHNYHHAGLVKHITHEEPANYDFNYDVHDPHTGDIKQQHETANNGVIHGQYSLIDADGYRRTVDYTADDHHGFNADVRREPLHGHDAGHHAVKHIAVAQPAIAVQKYVAPVQHHYSAPAPVQHHYSAPAPVHHYSVPAPVHHYSAPAPVQHHLSSPIHHSNNYQHHY